MRTIYFAYSDEVGEIEGMFGSDGTMLDFWACNDASWRNEYFRPFMKSLGFDVQNAPDWMVRHMEERASHYYDTEAWIPGEPHNA